MIICLMGPTASGKTQLAVELVKRFPFEIVSVDSAMVYRGLDIGTAKPEAAVLEAAPHRLLDIHEPSEPYSAAHFVKDATREMKAIIASGKTPLLVGGTMLYFQALQKGLSQLPSADVLIREQLTQVANEKGWEFLHKQLQVIDKEAAERIHPNDAQRIQRALEVYELTGKSLTSFQQHGLKDLPDFEFCNIAIAPSDRAILHERIQKRFYEMLSQGFLEEVQGLYARGDLNLDLPAIRSVGYRQAWEYLLGDCDYDTMCDKAIIATRQLAKRQLTWLRNWKQPIQWFDSEAKDLVQQVANYLNPLL